MTCKLWIERALPFADGSAPAAEAQAFAGHLQGCSTCRAEVEVSRSLIRTLRALPDPGMSREAVAHFDAEVLRRVAAFAPAPMAVMAEAAAPAYEGRAAAARAIAARSRRAGRPVFTQLSPLPSLTLASLGLAAASIVTTILFGSWIVRALGIGFAMAFTELAAGGVWIAERMAIKVIEIVAAGRILVRVLGNLSPWIEATRQLLIVRGTELSIAFALMIVLIGSAAVMLRRERRKAHEISRT